MAKADNKVSVKFKGNVRDYIFGETYSMTPEDAAVYTLLGYAEIVADVNNVEEIK